jgi:hypothetical protein
VISVELLGVGGYCKVSVRCANHFIAVKSDTEINPRFYNSVSLRILRVVLPLIAPIVQSRRHSELTSRRGHQTVCRGKECIMPIVV